MEPSWQPQGFYYMPNHARSSDRPGLASNHETISHPSMASDDGVAHRRSATLPSGPFPPPPLHSPTTQMGLPHFNSSYYSSSHYSSSGGHSASSSAPSNMPVGYTASMPNGSMPPTAGPGGYSYPSTSPLTHQSLPVGRNPPPPFSESPRMPPGVTIPWSSSPAFRHLSPTSPTHHLGLPNPTSSSTSSSSFPSVSKTPAQLSDKMSKRRSQSMDQSNESWDEEKYGLDDMDDESGEQPWGMPQEEYKALNPRDKKQVRNRIGARRFRAKRKNYVTSLEGSLRDREDELASLRAQIDSQRAEINELRGRLGIPPLPVPPAAESSLGLVVNQPEGWEDTKSGG